MIDFVTFMLDLSAGIWAKQHNIPPPPPTCLLKFIYLIKKL